jgi:trimeric autotransporter adhesin
MPLIYPPTLRDLYANTFSVTSSIMRTAPPEDFVLESDGNGATFWTSVLGSNAAASTLYVSESLTANRAFVDYLSSGTFLLSTNTYPVLNVSSLTLSTFTADSGYQDLVSSFSTFADSVVANTVYSQYAEIDNISTTYYRGNIYDVPQIETESISSLVVEAHNIIVEQTTLANTLQASTISTGIATIENATVQEFTRTLSLQTNTVFGNRIATRQASTVDLKVSTINGLTYPPEVTVSENLEASTLFAKDFISASLLNTHSLSTTILNSTRAFIDEYRTSLLSTYSVTAGFLNVQDLSISTFQTQSTIASKAIFQTLTTESLSTNLLETVSTDGSNATIQSIQTQNVYANNAAFTSANAVFVSTANLYVGEFTTTAPVEKIYLSSLSLQTGTLEASSIQTLYLSSGALKTEQTIANSVFGTYLSTSALYTNTLNLSSLQSEHFSTTANVTDNLRASTLTTEFISSGLLYATLGNADTWRTEFLSSQIGSISTPSQLESTFVGSLSTNTISTQLATVTAISSIFVSTSSIEFSYTHTSSLEAHTISSLQDYVSSLFVNQFAAETVSSLAVSANEGALNTVSTNNLSTQTFSANSGNAAYVLAREVYTNTLETAGVDYPFFYLNTLSTVLAVANQIQLSSLTANELSTTLFVGQTAEITDAIVETLHTSSFTGSYFQAIKFEANTFSIDDLYISSLDGNSYPPPLTFPSNLTVSSITVAETTTASTIHVGSLSTAQLYIGTLDTLSTYVTSISSIQSFFGSLAGSTLVGDFISANSVFIEQTIATQLNASTFSTVTLTSENNTISTVNAQIISTLLFETDVLYTSSLIGTEISTTVWQGQTHQGLTLDANAVSSGSLNITEIDLEKFSAKLLSTIYLSTQDAYISSLVTNSIVSQSTIYNSSFLKELTVSFISSAAADVGSMNLSSARLNTLSTALLTTSSISFSTITTDYLSTSTVTAETASLIQADIGHASTLSVYSDSLFASTFLVDTLSTTNTVLQTMHTSSLELQTLSVNKLIVLETQISSIYVDQISAGIVNSQGFMSSLYTDSLSISSFTANAANISSLYADSISTSLITASVANVSSLHTGYIANPTTLVDTLIVNSTLQTEFYNASTLITDYISTFSIDAQYVRSYTMVVYGGNTLHVSGSSIFDGIIVAESEFLADDLVVCTLKYVTIYPQGAIFDDFNTNILNSSTIATVELESHGFSANFIETQRFETSIADVSSLVTPLVSTNQLDGTNTILSSLYVTAATTIGRIDQVPFISSLSTVSETAIIQQFETPSMYTSSLYAGSILANNIYTHFLSATSIVIPSNGVTNDLQATSISTTSILFDGMTTASTSAFTLSTIEIHANLANTYVSSIDFTQFSTQYLRATDANGFGLSTQTVSTNTLAFTTGLFTTISTNHLSSINIYASTVTIQNVMDSKYTSGPLVGTTESIFTLQTFADSISTNFVSSQRVVVDSLNASTLSTTLLYANSLQTSNLIANISTNFFTSLENRIGTLDVNFVSAGLLNAPGSRFVFNSTFTSSLTTRFATVSNLTLQDSLFTTVLTAGDLYSRRITMNTMNISTISSVSALGISSGTATYLSTNSLSTGRLQGATNSEFFLGALSATTISTNRVLARAGEATMLTTRQISTGRLFAGDTVINALSTTNLDIGSLTIQNVTANTYNTNSISSGTLQNTPQTVTFDLISTTVLSSGVLALSGQPGMYFQVYSGDFQQTTFSNSIDNSYYFDVYSGLYGSRILANSNGYSTDFSSDSNATGRVLCNALSVIWTGYFRSLNQGNYTFNYRADNFGRFWIGDGIKPKSAYPFYSPKQISGLYTWLDATDSNTMRNSSDNQASYNQTIKTWIDKSGNGRNASNVSALTSFYPTWCNDTSLGKPILWFNANSCNQMNIGGFTYPFDTYIILNPFMNNAQKDILGAGNTIDANSLRAIGTNQFSNYVQSSTGNSNTYTSPLAEQGNQYRLLRWTVANNCNMLMQNSIPLMLCNTYSWANAPTEATGRFRIGTGTTCNSPVQLARMYNGNIGEIIIYDRILTDPERFGLENYLSQKWGISIAGPYSSNNQAGGGGTVTDTYSITCNLQANTYYPLRIQLANNVGPTDRADIKFWVTTPTPNSITTCNLIDFVNTTPFITSTTTNFITLDTRFSTIQTVQYGNFQRLSTLFLSTSAITTDIYNVTTLSTTAISSIVANVRIFNASNINSIGSISTGLLQTSNIQAIAGFTENISSQSLSSSSAFISSLQNATFARGMRLFANELTVTGSISTLSNVTSLVNTGILNFSTISSFSLGLLNPGDIVYRNFTNYNANNYTPNTTATNAITTRNLDTGPIATNHYTGIQINNLSSTTNSFPDLQLGDWGVYFRPAPDNTFTNRLESLEDGFMFNSTLFVHRLSNCVGINTKITNSNVSTFALNIEGSLNVRAENAYKPTAGAWIGASDERVKNEIVPADLDRCYEISKTLSLFNYNFVEEYCKEFNIANTRKTGFIAQHVSSFFPNAVQIKKILWLNDGLSLNGNQPHFANYGALQKLISSFDTINITISTFSYYPNTIEKSENLVYLNESLQSSYTLFQEHLAEKNSTLEGYKHKFQTLENSFITLQSYASILLQETREKKSTMEGTQQDQSLE